MEFEGKTLISTSKGIEMRGSKKKLHVKVDGDDSTTELIHDAVSPIPPCCEEEESQGCPSADRLIALLNGAICLP